MSDDQPQKPSLYYEGMEDDNYLPPKPDATPEWTKEILKFDGVAAVNLAEPSEGDLERVVKAYRECRDECDDLKARVMELEQNEKIQMEATDGLIALNNRICAERDAAQARIAALESNYWYRKAQGAENIQSENKRIFNLLEEKEQELAAARARIAELEGQLKAKVSLETVFVADSYEAHLTQANERIAELEKDNLLALDIANKFANERDELKEREQKLVAALNYALGKFNAAMDDPDVWLAKCANGAQMVREALAEHKGGVAEKTFGEELAEKFFKEKDDKL